MHTTNRVFYHILDDNRTHYGGHTGHGKLGWHWTDRHLAHRKFPPSGQSVAKFDCIRALTALQKKTFLG